MAGNQSRGLVAASKTRGWDPTKIQGFTDAEGGDIAQWDYDPGNIVTPPNTYVGDAVPNTPLNPPEGDSTATSPVAPAFNVPDAGRETTNRATRNASPWVGGRQGG